MKYKQELSRQLALDYCCNAEDILDNKNHFNVYEQRDGRRRFEEQDDCVLKVIVVNDFYREKRDREHLQRKI